MSASSKYFLQKTRQFFLQNTCLDTSSKSQNIICSKNNTVEIICKKKCCNCRDYLGPEWRDYGAHQKAGFSGRIQVRENLEVSL